MRHTLYTGFELIAPLDESFEMQEDTSGEAHSLHVIQTVEVASGVASARLGGVG